jgi:isoquinoline 1-oxidoreductase beta subunit
MKGFNPDRRSFLKLSSVAAGSSLIIGINLGCSPSNSTISDHSGFQPNAWLRISSDESVTVVVAESEMGQGPYTLMPMMVAEELEVSWDKVLVERASVDPVYGYQMTGGSSSIRKGWKTLRQAGAVAREMLVKAAALTFKVEVEQCRAKKGYVFITENGKKLSFGQLVPLASTLDIPEQAFLKEPDEFEIIGQSVKRKDIPPKLNGQAVYGIDIRLPEQLYATVVHCPVFGGKFKNFIYSESKQQNDIIDIFPIDEGLAIVARDTWSAFKAARLVEIEWNYGSNQSLSTESLQQQIRAADENNSTVTVKEKGNIRPVFEQNLSAVSSNYLQPFQAHMTMEPMNCTTHFKENGQIEIWTPTQSPSAAYATARELTQSKLERGIKKISYKLIDGYDQSIAVNTTLLGGGFGRRLQQDYVAESVQIASRYNKPVQLVWSREEDIQHDFYHPMTVHEMKATLDDKGMPIAWSHHIKGSDVSSYGAEHFYDIPNQEIKVFDIGKVLPKGPWRSVAAHYNIFAVEHFIDQIALEHHLDPLELRLGLLSKADRLRHTLELVKDRVGWKGNLIGNLSMGCATAYTFGSYVSQVVQLEMLSEGAYRINKVVCAIDCGIVINPDIVKQQIEGSIIFGLSAATKSKIMLKNGRVQQSNFHDYPILRINEIPDIEVIIVQNQQDPQGIGEPGVPPVAPALANALMAQTGMQTSELPIKL